MRLHAPPGGSPEKPIKHAIDFLPDALARPKDAPGTPAMPESYPLPFPEEQPMPPFNYFDRSDADAMFFIDAMIARFGLIVGTSGNPVTITKAPSHYVIPGAHVVVSDGGTSVPVWLGVNCDRIFFIIRLTETPERCKKLFEFAFGGAGKVGWSFYYEPTIEGETSVWGTVETKADFVVGKHNTIPGPELTQGGAFWANDTALMMQSAIRTIQREAPKLSEHMPEPL
jgi:hypothetical protein